MEQEVNFNSGNIKLAGTLALPNANVRTPPAFLFINGSGPTDRNENPDFTLMVPKEKEKLAQSLKAFNLEPSKFKLNIFNEMSDYFVKDGFATFRYDKRGIGKSEGDYKTAGFSDLVSDARAAVKFLQGRKEIGSSKIIVLGHSEGGIIGPVLCSEDPAIDALVICAGTSQKLDEIMMQQAEAAKETLNHLTPEQKEKLGIKGSPDPVGVMKEFIEKVKRGDEYVEMEGHRVFAKWYREHFNHDPLETIKKVKCPVLIVQGEKDFQVPFSNAIALRDTLEKSKNGKVRLLLFPNIDHLLKFEPAQSSELSYISKINRKVEPLILKSISSWAKSITG